MILKLLNSTKLQILIICLLTFLSYSNIFSNQFINDDIDIIINWPPGHSTSNIPHFFLSAETQPTPHIGYRPIRTSILALIYTLFGPNPTAFHTFTIIIHLTNTILIYFITRRLLS